MPWNGQGSRLTFAFRTVQPSFHRNFSSYVVRLLEQRILDCVKKFRGKERMLGSEDIEDVSYRTCYIKKQIVVGRVSGGSHVIGRWDW